MCTSTQFSETTKYDIPSCIIFTYSRRLTQINMHMHMYIIELHFPHIIGNLQAGQIIGNSGFNT